MVVPDPDPISTAVGKRPPAAVYPPLSYTLLLCALSYILHLGYAFGPLARANHFPMDEGLYWDLARNLADHGRLALSTDAFATVAKGESTLFWTPGYPLLLALLLKSGSAAPDLLIAIQTLMVSLLPLLLRPIAAKLLPRAGSASLLIISAFYPYYFQLSSQVASETPALFLSLAGLALALGPQRWKTWQFVALGTVLAWLCLTRPEFILFSGAVLLWTCLKAVRHSPRTSYGRPILLLVVFSAWMAPWLIRNMAIAGRPIFTTRSAYSLAFQNEYFHLYSMGRVGSEAEWIGSFPAFDTELERYRYLKRRANDFIREHPGIYAGLCAKRLASFALPQEAKTAIYRLFGRKDVKGRDIPIWFRASNWFFILGLWGLFLPGIARLLIRGSGPWHWLAPPSLLAVILLGQMAVYAFVAYVEYQRSILDPIFLLLGACFWLQPGRRDMGLGKGPG